MRDWICGFFMAWGMFLAIPCPRKIWSEGARQKMLVCTPLRRYFRSSTTKYWQ